MRPNWCRTRAALVIAALACGPAQAQSVATDKPVYQPNETITVTFANAPGHNNDYVTLAPLGAPATINIGGQFLRGETRGSRAIRGQPGGVFEARLISGQTAQVLAAQKFAVGRTCLQDAVAQSQICDLSISVEKPEFALGEPIGVAFQGLPGQTGNEVLVLAPANAPDGKYAEAHRAARKMYGQHYFKGQPAGDYEIRLHLNGNPTPHLRVPFRVSAAAAVQTDRAAAAPPASAAAPPSSGKTPVASLPQPGLAGHWIGYVQCERKNRRAQGTGADARLVFTLGGAGSPGTDLFVLIPGQDGLALRMTESIDPSGSTLSLDPQAWIYPPRANTAPVALRATLDPNGLILTGSLSNLPGCPSFTAYKHNRDNRPRAGGVLALVAQYGNAATNTENCTNFLRFTSHDAVAQSSGVDIPEVVVDGDLFYTMVGVPYEGWQRDDRSVFERFWSMCVREIGKDRTSIQAQQLLQAAQTRRALQTFLIYTQPASAAQGRDQRSHIGFLGNYAALTGLRISRLYADLETRTAQAMEATRSNLASVLNSIEVIGGRQGPYIALPDRDRDSFVALLRQERARLSGTLADAEFAAFDIARYSRDLDGLIEARGVEAAIVADIEGFALPAQTEDIRRRFVDTFADLSATVTGQLIAAIPAPAPQPQALIEGRTHTAQAERHAIPHLAKADQTQFRTALARRNSETAAQIAPGFPDWLMAHISPDEQGRQAIEALAQDMLGTPLHELGAFSGDAAYRTLARAILSREERLHFELCALPPGFEELAELLCAESAVIAMFDG
ncbi:hypothetical protein [Pseudooceanicola sp.]|uniref:hypothetical protein n=1 Tax=Pseudooceanicola sp. TaxID=1914328 RepID=UPI0035187A92